MQISLRSPLTVGTVAVVGAGAIALAPVTPRAATAPVLAAPSGAQVALTATSLPFDIVGLLQNLGIGGAIPGIVDALPSLLPTDIVTAVVNEFAAEAGPLLTTAAGEVFGYFGTALTALATTIPQRIGEAVVGLPAVLASAVQSVSTGDLPAALQTLSTGLVAPLTAVAQAIEEAGQGFQDFLTGQINTLGTQLPGVLFNSIQKVINTNFQSVLEAVQQAVSGLFGGLIPSAASLPAAAAKGGAVAASVAVPTVSRVSAAAVVDAVAPASSPSAEKPAEVKASPVGGAASARGRARATAAVRAAVPASPAPTANSAGSESASRAAVAQSAAGKRGSHATAADVSAADAP